jgi:hypothetical protein
MLSFVVNRPLKVAVTPLRCHSEFTVCSCNNLMKAVRPDDGR